MPIRFFVAIAVVAAFAIAVRRPLRTTFSGMRDAVLGWPRDVGAAHLVAFMVIVATGVWLRWRFIDSPMRWDESFTVITFGVPRFAVGLANSNLNNHPLNSLLIHVAYSLFGAGHRVVRAPELVAGILAVPIVYVAGYRLYGRNVALLAAALIAASAQATEYSTNARGNELTLLWAAVLVALVPSLIAGTNPVPWGAFALATALGLYSQPVFVYAWIVIVAAVAVTGAVGRASVPPSRFLVRFGITVAAGLAFAALLYGPILRPFITQILHMGYANDPIQLGRELWRAWTLGLPQPIKVVLAAGFVLAAVALPATGRLRFPLAASVVLLALVIVAIGRAAPFTRYFLALLPLVLISALAGLLVWTPVQHVLDRSAVRVAVAALAAGGAVWVAHVVTRDGLANEDSSVLPSAEQIASLVGPRLRTNDRLIVSGTAWPIEAYTFFSRGWSAWKYVVPSEDRAAARAGTTYVVVDTAMGETLPAVLERTAAGTGLRNGKLLARYQGADVYELERPQA